MATIVIDPGHGGLKPVGGSDPNHAQGPSGLLEKTITLDIGKRVADSLVQKGHQVVLTRTGDTNLGLADRAKFAKDRRAPVFVSIHFNGFDHKVQGTETFCHLQHSALSAALCRHVQAGAVNATGLNDRNAGAPGGVKTQALGVLNPVNHDNQTACVLCEVSFMDVPAEDARLQTTAYKNRVANGIASGIGAFLGEALQATPEAMAMALPEFEDGYSILQLNPENAYAPGAATGVTKTADSATRRTAKKKSKTTTKAKRAKGATKAARKVSAKAGATKKASTKKTPRSAAPKKTAKAARAHRATARKGFSP